MDEVNSSAFLDGGNSRHGHVDFTRDDIIESINDPAYSRSPFYRLAELIKAKKPQMSNEDIIEKYFDKEANSYLIIDGTEKGGRRLAYDIDTNLLIVCDFFKNRDSYMKVPMERLQEYGDELCIRSEKPEKNIPFLIESTFDKDKLRKLLKVFLMEPSRRVVEMLDEYGISRETVKEIVTENIKEMYPGQRHKKNGATACCGKKYNNKFDLYILAHGPCPFCGVVRVLKDSVDTILYDVSDLSTRKCLGCTQFTCTFFITKDNGRVYSHAMCCIPLRHKYQSIKDLKIYDNNIIPQNINIDKLLYIHQVIH